MTVTAVAAQFHRDLSAAWRGLKRRPARSSLMIAVLAAALATNAVMFTVLDRMLFAAPAGISDPAHLLRVVESARVQGRPALRDRLSYPAYARLKERNPAIDQTAGLFNSTVSVGEGSEAFPAIASFVTSSFFPLLGVRPVIGRGFVAEENEPPIGARVAVISNALWRRLFLGDSAVVARSIRVDGETYRVIGVLPAEFHGTDDQLVDLWLPLSVAGYDRFGPAWDFDSGAFWIETLGRPAPGVSLKDMSTAADAGTPNATRQLFEPFNRARGAGRSMETRVALWLGAVAGIVLVIACANIGNMYLVEGIERRDEFAVRVAIGATRTHLLSTVVARAVLVTGIAWILGTLLAVTAGRVLAGLAFQGGSISFNGRLVVATGLLGLVVSLITAVAPVLQLRDRSVGFALRAASTTPARVGAAARLGLLSVQVVLTTLLLCGAALFLKSFRAVTAVDAGFAPDQVIVVDLDPQRKKPANAVEQEYQLVAQHLSARRQVVRTAVGVTAPYLSGLAVRVASPGSAIPEADLAFTLYVNAVSPNFFRTLGLRTLRGVTFENTPTGERVSVVSNQLARSIWPNDDAIGKCLHLYARSTPCYRVIGVIADPERDKIGEAPEPQFFVPLSAAPGLAQKRLLFLEVKGRAEAAVPTIVRGIQSTVPSAGYPVVRSLDQMIRRQQRPWALGASLFTAFGSLALFIACLGLYNVILHDVRAREKELAIRVTLGASVGHVARSVLSRTGAAVSAGLTLGLLSAVWMGHLLQPILFRTQGVDGIIACIVVVVTLVVAFMAAGDPLRRAVSVDPATVLRQ